MKLPRILLALIAFAVVACQDGTPVQPAEDSFDLTIEGARIDLSIFDGSALGAIGGLIGVETATGGPLRGLGDPPIFAAPTTPGELPSVTPLETTVVLYVVTLWLFENGFLDAPSAVSALLPVVGAYSWLLVGDPGGLGSEPSAAPPGRAEIHPPGRAKIDRGSSREPDHRVESEGSAAQ